MMGVEIAGLGHYAPSRIVGNREIEDRLGLTDGWIARRTGIHERRFAEPDEALSDLAVAAGDMALQAGGLSRSDVALLLLATSTPDHLLPPSAPLVADRLGLKNAGGIDMAGACAGFIYALTLADSFVRTHQAPVLVIAGNVLSRRINPEDRASSVLFSDAAGAMLLRPTPRADAGVAGCALASSGQHYGLISIPGGGSRRPFTTVDTASETLMVISNGSKVFSEAVAMMSECAKRALQKAGCTTRDVTCFLPHQANARMMTSVAHDLGIESGRTLSSIARYGNSSAATIPFTLSLAHHDNDLAAGSRILMTAAGAGLAGGAVLLKV